jgi:hypothetical protein
VRYRAALHPERKKQRSFLVRRKGKNLFEIDGSFFKIIFQQIGCLMKNEKSAQILRSAHFYVLERIPAESEGFEPSVRIDPYVGLANRWFQPLTQLSFE